MTFSWLLAKKAVDSDNPEPEQTLVGHTTAVLNAMRILQEMFMAEVMALNPGISSDCWQTALFCSAWLHDLGKANDHFQKMLRTTDFRQGVRHETLGLIVLSELLDPWLANLWFNYPPFLKAAIFLAVGGHHLKFPDQEQRGHSAVVFLGGHPQLYKLLEIGRERFGLAPPPRLANRSFSLLALDGIDRNLSKLRRQLDFEFSSKEKLFIAAVKATLMAADLAGSALPPRGIELEFWLRERLQVTLERVQLEKVVQRKLQDQDLRPFQRQVQESAGATLVEAGCGSGKTVAAYLWAAQKAAGRRLFFCYPTTTTASEGFSGYLREPDFEALLIHSRASLDYRLLENMPPHSKAETELRSLRLEALDTWTVPAVVCTAHTVLGLLQNVRRAIYAWPSLVRAVFVFDEIHSFSPLLFQHLLRFLEVFRTVPVLLMTATLPSERKEALERVCLDRGGLTIIQGPRVREEAKRYLLQRLPEQEAWNYVQHTLAKREKVLWVVNTVDRAINLARQALEQGLPVQPFHSRYRYRDRLVRQRQVIDGFSPERGALLAITTQVVEISLDISADLLVTEYAPVASLIQRLGRLNRFVEVPEEVKPAIFLRPENAFPYAGKDAGEKYWGPIEKWLDLSATGLPRSQRDLAAAFIEVERNDSQLLEDHIFCDWLDDPWSSLSNRHPLMEPGYTIEVVREEDAAEGLLPEMAMPMPFPHGNAWRSWQQRGRYFIAPLGAIDYDPFWGGRYAHEKPHFEII
jgi:CRISPR-associated endonuclease/helicase Cas3